MSTSPLYPAAHPLPKPPTPLTTGSRQFVTPMLVDGYVFEKEGVNAFVSAMKDLPPGSAAVVDFFGHFAPVLKVGYL